MMVVLTYQAMKGDTSRIIPGNTSLITVAGTFTIPVEITKTMAQDGFQEIKMVNFLDR